MAEQPHDTDRPHDVGKTSGGGSLGHDQPQDVAEQAPIRNQADDRRKQPEDTADHDPVMPSDDSALRTKI
jgi:hypothetical protein